MKKTIKILSLVLLLALLVSAFAVFSAFADETESVTPGSNDEEAKLIYSLDDRVGDSDHITASTSQIALRKDKGHFSNGKYSMYPVLVSETATNDVRYYNLGYVGWDVNEAYTKQPFLNQYIGGTYAGDKKDSDYLILDFDYAVSGTQPNYLHIQPRFGWEGQGEDDDPKSGTSIRIYGDPDDNSLVVKTINSTTEVTHTSAIPGFTNGWAHITVIMDFSDSTDTICGAPIYVYINGVRTVDSAQATVRNNEGFNVISGDNWRFYVSNGTKNDDETYTPKGKDESVSVANYTVKTLPAGYNGTLTQLIGIGAMASGSAVTLDNYPELAYCLTNTPDAVKVADIERAGVENPIPVYSVDHLDANLLPGDVVTLYKNIKTRYILVPANEAGESLVTFVDNGFSVARLLPVQYKDGGYIYDWIIRNPSTGASRSVADVQTESDTLGAQFSSLKTASYITLLDDVTVAPAGFTWNKNTGTIVFDLNQHSLTTKQTGSYTTATPLKIVYKDGTVTNDANGTANCLMYTTAAGAFFVFDGLTFNNVSRNDLRSSCNIIINNSTVNGNTSSKAKDAIFEARTTSTSFLTKTFINVRCSTINLGYGTFVNVSNVATKSTKRGSVNVGINFVESSANNGTKYVVDIIYEACQATDNTNKNQNNVSVNFFNFIANTNSSLVYAKLGLLTKPITGGKADATGLYAGTKVKVYNSDITTSGNVFRSDGTTQSGFLDTKNSVYTHEALVELANSSIKVGATRGIIGRATETLTNATVIYGEGVKLSNDKLVDDGNSAEVITTVYSDGVKIAQQNNEKYPYVTTSDYKVVKYYTDYEKTELVDKGVWLTKDAPAMELPALPEVSNTTAYRYAVDETGATYIQCIPAFPLKVNLTLSESIALNIYIPTTIGEFDVVALSFNGVAYNKDAATVTLADGNTYYKVVVEGITPTKAMDNYNIGVSVLDINNEMQTVYKEISVVDYLGNVYANSTSETDKDFVQKIFTYLVNAVEYAKAIDPEAANTIKTPVDSRLTANELTAEKRDEYVADGELGISATLDLVDGYRWIVGGFEAGEEVLVKYNVNGDAVEKTLVADDEGNITITVKACDLLDDITVGEKTFTFVHYAARVFEAEGIDDVTKTLINAIYDYALAASEF